LDALAPPDARRTTAAPRARGRAADEEDAEGDAADADDNPFRPRGVEGIAREARAFAAGARGAPARARVAVVVTLDAACMVARRRLAVCSKRRGGRAG
jgi:hypothetical protein